MAQDQYLRDKAIRCPCAKDKNKKFLTRDIVGQHLLRNGFMPNYWYWTAHWETRMPSVDTQGKSYGTAQFNSDEGCSRYERLVFDVFSPNTYEFEYSHNEEAKEMQAIRIMTMKILICCILLKGRCTRVALNLLNCQWQLS
ncbi:hypothetical protein ACFE04_011356 [Oxalis oulophora]